jgi:asparagine synthase (glutamine-hydrolysing)
VAIIGPDGSVRQRTYTSLYTDLRKLADRPQPYDRAAKARFAAELGEAVSTRLVSDVPVGTALSGGIDSSTVVATVSRLLRERDRSTSAVGAVQQAFSAVFPGEVNDEERYVDAMAAHCPALEVRKVEPNVTGFLRDMTDFVRSQEEPVVSTGPYAQYCVMRRASQRITVMLDGQGADEMLAGYLPYYAVYARQQLARGRAVRAFGGLALAADAMWRLVRPRLRDAVRRRSGLPVTALLGRDFVSAHAGERFDVVRDNLKARLEDDLFRHSIPALLRYEDRNTMRFSIEGRVPFLRSSLLRTLWALDDAAIVSGGWNKRALRDATRRSLPRVVNQRRSKIGFTTPEDAWFLRMAGPISTVFASDSFAARRYFDAPAVRRAFRLFAQGAANTETMTFWRIFNVELWLREFIDAPAVAAPGASGAMAPPGRTP